MLNVELRAKWQVTCSTEYAAVQVRRCASHFRKSKVSGRSGKNQKKSEIKIYHFRTSHGNLCPNLCQFWPISRTPIVRSFPGPIILMTTYNLLICKFTQITVLMTTYDLLNGFWNCQLCLNSSYINVRLVTSPYMKVRKTSI